MFPSILLLLATASGPDAIHTNVDGTDRLAYVIAPSHKTGSKPPMLLMFHGHGGSAERCMKRFYMEKRWPEAIVVYLEGLEVLTAGGSGLGWKLLPNNQNRDIRFVDALLPKVLKQYNGDPKEVFAWGFSNGGMFTYTLWSARPNKFAGFCPSGACIVSDDFKLTQPKPAFVTISGNDETVPTILQKAALAQVERVDGSAKTGKRYGSAGTYFKGLKPVVMWDYNGGHEFPFESFPKLIEFFKSVAAGKA